MHQLSFLEPLVQFDKQNKTRLQDFIANMRPLKKKNPGAPQEKYGINFETNIQLLLELEKCNGLNAEELSDANHPLS